MDRWIVGALFTITLALAGAWGAAIHSQLAEIKGVLSAIASAQSAFATDVAVLRLRVDRLERASAP